MLFVAKKIPQLKTRQNKSSADINQQHMQPSGTGKKGKGRRR